MQYPLPAFLPHIPIPVRMQHTLPIVRKPGMPPLKRRATLTWAVRHINGDAVKRHVNQQHVGMTTAGLAFQNRHGRGSGASYVNDAAVDMGRSRQPRDAIQRTGVVIQNADAESRWWFMR